MTCEVGVVRGGTIEEVKAKKFNIYIGISLGNKWFTEENIKEQILWGLKYTKEKLGLLVADTLHAINYEVRNDEKPEIALSKSIRKGNEMIDILKEIIKTLPKEKQKVIEIIRWDSVKADPFSKKAIPFLFNEYKENIEFNKKILAVIERYLKHSNESLGKKKMDKLSSYILYELPEFLNGFTFKNTYYNCYIYPFDGDSMRMVDKIQKRKLFPYFHDKLNIKNNVFVELKIK